MLDWILKCERLNRALKSFSSRYRPARLLKLTLDGVETAYVFPGDVWRLDAYAARGFYVFFSFCFIRHLQNK